MALANTAKCLAFLLFVDQKKTGAMLDAAARACPQLEPAIGLARRAAAREGKKAS